MTPPGTISELSDEDNSVPTPKDWEEMYLAQCACTDKWVAKYREEVERKADATLLARCAELEQIAERANKLLGQAQGETDWSALVGEVGKLADRQLRERGEAVDDLALKNEFTDWWGKDGYYYDPDGDVSWYDKRHELAMYAYFAGNNSHG